MTPRTGNSTGHRRRIFSVYLTEAEEERILALAEANGTSINFVVRAAVRGLLGMPTPRLEQAQPLERLDRRTAG